jgi:hypothetical protein
MSTINTNGIDANYPIPGQNNSTQGFRTNFAAIKQNLNIAGNEITDLQNKVVLKSALANSTIDNNMGNTLIANASTLQFRQTTYNLGNALADNVVVDCSLGDVQYGNLAGNIFLTFGSWIPTNTLGGIQLNIGRPNVNADFSITFPSEAQLNENSGWALLENSGEANAYTTVTFPYNCTELQLQLTSVDCGNTIQVTPLNRPSKTTQIQQRTPPSTGQLGDTVGTVCVDPGTTQLVITGANVTGISTNSFFTTSDTSSLTPGLPVTLTGVDYIGGLGMNSGYYVGEILSSTTFTLTWPTPGGPNVQVFANVVGNSIYMNPVQYMYVAVENFSANYGGANNNPISILSTTSPNLIVANSFSNVGNNFPVMFSGSTANLANVGLEANKVYYIKNAYSGNSTFTVSEFRDNGVAGIEYQGVLTVAANTKVDFTSFNGPDIFRRIPLQPF